MKFFYIFAKDLYYEIFFSEESIDYNNYKFGYSVNLELDEDDSIEECFHKGFLPFTGDINNENEVYYMARSLRVNSNLYKRISENLRVIKNAKKSNNFLLHQALKTHLNMT